MRAALGLCLALAFAGAAAAQESPSEVTDGEIAKYKKLAQGACRDAGLKRGDSEARIDAFCACMIAQLEQTMRRPEWQQAYFYSLRNDAEQENKVLAPHAANVKHCAKQ